MPWLEFLVSFIVTFIAGSFIEWFIHKEFMHSVRYFRIAFERHAVKHHKERRAPGKYLASADELRDYHLFETSFMPALWILNFPCYLLAWRIFGPWAALGCIVGAAAYIGIYEVLHWYMHCDQDFWFRHHRWFQFLSEHHRRHHHRATINYNVVFPLADLVLGTFSLLPLDPEPVPPHRPGDDGH